MRLSVILVLAAPWINLAEAVLPISSHGAPDVLQAAKQLDQRNVSTFVVRAWDPSKVANDAMWNKYVSKGQHLKCIMEAPDTGAGWLEQDSRTPPSAASKWSGDLSDALQTWYWHESTVNQDRDCDFEKKGLKGAFEGVGLNAKQSSPPTNGDNTCYRIEHVDEAMTKDKINPKKTQEQKYKVGEKEFTATGGLYWFALNQKGGAVIAMNLENPLVGTKYNWDRLATSAELPELRLCSDILWGYWMRNNPNVKSLRVYGAHNVVNEDTAPLIVRALTNNGHERITGWPGVSFDIASPEGHALIGSPIGATVAHMLTGHKDELGIKWIKKVSVFTKDARPDGLVPKNMEMHMFFHIEDVPTEEIIDPEKDKDKEKGPKDNGIDAAMRQVHIRNKGGNIVREHVFRL